MINQAMDARLQIRYRRDWPEDLDFENRTVAVNLTDETGLGVLNMTGEGCGDGGTGVCGQN